MPPCCPQTVSAHSIPGAATLPSPSPFVGRSIRFCFKGRSTQKRGLHSTVQSYSNVAAFSQLIRSSLPPPLPPLLCSQHPNQGPRLTPASRMLSGAELTPGQVNRNQLSSFQVPLSSCANEKHQKTYPWEAVMMVDRGGAQGRTTKRQVTSLEKWPWAPVTGLSLALTARVSLPPAPAKDGGLWKSDFVFSFCCRRPFLFL